MIDLKATVVPELDVVHLWVNDAREGIGDHVYGVVRRWMERRARHKGLRVNRPSFRVERLRDPVAGRSYVVGEIYTFDPVPLAPNVVDFLNVTPIPGDYSLRRS